MPDEGFRIASAWVQVTADTDAADRDVDALLGKLDTAAKRDWRLRVSLDGADAAVAEAAKVQAAIDAIHGTEISVGLGAPDSSAAALDAMLRELQSQSEELRLQTEYLDESLTALGIVQRNTADSSADLMMQTELLREGFANLDNQLDGTITRTGALAAAQEGAAASSAHASGSYGGWMGMLTRSIPLFGGLLGSVELWHLALDGALEATISLTAASLALTAGLVAMEPAARDIYNHLAAVNDVSSALGVSIPPLAGHFSDLSKALAPQVVEAYGGALNLLSADASSSGGMFGKVAGEVTTGIDDIIAKVDLWMAAQKSAGGILQSGVGFLHQFAQVTGEVLLALDNLMKADPGTAHFLLDVVEGAGKLLDVITSLPKPVLYAAMAMHSFYMWGGLLGTMLAKLAGVAGLDTLAGKFGLITRNEAAAAAEAEKAAAAAGKAETAFAGIGSGGWAIILALAGALAFVAEKGTDAQRSVTGFLASMNEQLAQDNASQAILGIAGDIGQLQFKMDSLSLSSATAQIHGFTSLAQDEGYALNSTWGHIANLFTSRSFSAAGTAISGLWDDLAGTKAQAAQVALSRDLQAYHDQITRLIGDSGNEFREVGTLMKGTTTTTDTFVSHTAPLVHVFGAVTDSVKTTTTAGYTYSQALALMDLAGVKASDSFEVMRQKVDDLVTGYKNMSVQGGILSSSVEAVTFASELQSSKITQLTQSFDTFFKMLSGGATGFVTFEQGLATMAANAKASGASITGLNANSLTLRSSFLQSAQAAQQQMDALMTLASAAGLGARGTDMLTQSGKDLVAQLLPAAKGSSEMTAILYGLAQQAGYQGADSFKALATWIGNTIDPAKNLDKIQSQLTVDAGNLTKDVDNLATAIGQDLNQAMAQAILQASGGQQAFDKFATAVVTNKNNIGADQTAASGLASELITLTGNTKNAHAEFDVMAQKLGMTRAQADELWSSVQHGAGTISQSHTQRQALIDDVIATGEKAHDSQGDIAGMIAQVLKIPKSAAMKILIDAEGKVSVSGATGVLPTPSGKQPVLGELAGGGPVYGPGGPTDDVIPAMLSAGEYVMPAAAVDYYGTGFMEDIRARALAAGGPVIQGNPSVLSGATEVGAYNTTKTEGADTAYADLKKAMSSASAALSAQGVLAAGAGVARWAGTVNQVLKMLEGAGQQPGDLAIVLSQMSTESGGNPYAVNLSDSNARAGHPSTGLMQVIAGTYAAYGAPKFGYPAPVANGVSENPLANIYAGLNYAIACVPLGTMILTRRGWLKHDEVRAGDETIGYNPQTRRNEWTQITAVHHYDDAPLVRIGNKYWSALCTPNHRWLVKPHGAAKPELRETCGDAWAKIGRKPSFVRPGISIGRNARIVLAAPADTGDGLEITETEAELLGWILGDGYISRHPNFRVGIAQAKPANIPVIRNLLRNIPHSERMHPPSRQGYLPVYRWRLRAGFARSLLARSGMGEDPERFVCGMSADQRHAFMRGLCGAEGTFKDNAWVVPQNYGPKLDAIILAAYLEGHRPGIEHVMGNAWSPEPSAKVRHCRPVVAPADLQEAGRSAVWCVTTTLGTWTVRQDDNVFLTGNSYGPGWRGVLGHGHGYAAGGPVKPGRAARYASGGIIPGGTMKLTPEASAGLTVALAYLNGKVTTIATETAEQKAFIADIHKYYGNGAAAQWRTAMVQRQTTALEKITSKESAVSAKIASAQSYQASVTSGLSGYADLSSLTPGPVYPGGSQALAGTAAVSSQLAAKLTSLKAFAAALKKLTQAKLSPALFQQVVALGPDAGLVMANEILADPSLIKTLNGEESQITAEETAIGQGAASSVYEGSWTTGPDWLGGLQKQESGLEAEMKKLGDTLGKEAAKWFKVPPGKLPRKLAAGGTLAPYEDAVVAEAGTEAITTGGAGAFITAGPSGATVTPVKSAGGGQSVVNNFNYYGPQHPSPEMKAMQMRDLALVLGGVSPA
jgi:hypothetical protein